MEVRGWKRELNAGVERQWESIGGPLDLSSKQVAQGPGVRRGAWACETTDPIEVSLRSMFWAEGVRVVCRRERAQVNGNGEKKKKRGLRGDDCSSFVKAVNSERCSVVPS